MADDDGTPPDLVIMPGFRTFLALTGLSTMVISFWVMERRWDEEGTAAYQRAKEKTHENSSDYRGNIISAEVDENMQVSYTPAPEKAVPNADGSQYLVSVGTEDDDEKDGIRTGEVVIPREELEVALPFPQFFLAGAALWALSFLCSPLGGVRIYANVWNIFCMLLIPLMGGIVAYPLRKSTIDRDLDLKKKSVTSLLVLSIWFVLCAILDKESQAPWYFCCFGALFVLASYHVLRRSRKMGMSWDLEGKPNLDIVSQNLGSLLLIFGLFLFWSGTNTVVEEDPDLSSIPIYINYRAWFVFIASLVVIVPSLLALDFAFDEGSERVGNSLDGRTLLALSKKSTTLSLQPFAMALETPYIFIAGWVFLGFCSFMPFGGGFSMQKLFGLLIASVIGPIYALKVLPAYWDANQSEYKRWTYVYCGVMILFVTCVGLKGEAALIMSMLGVIFILGGQHVDFVERKRGTWWIKNRTVNDNPKVFGFGQPVYLIGWVLLCLAMSMPM